MRFGWIALVIALVGWWGAVAGADPAPDASAPDAARVRSTELFKQGRELLAAGDLKAACARFAESQALFASSGTLLNLGDCKERQGLTASAWRAFRAAAALATERGRPEQAGEASRRATLIRKKLEVLVFVFELPSDQRPGLVVIIDGVVSEPLETGEHPIDPGRHQIEVAPPGLPPYRVAIETMPGPGRSSPLTIPPLIEWQRKTSGPEPQPVPEAELAAPPAAAKTHDRPSRWTGRRKLALGFLVVAVASAAVGTYAGLLARDRWSDAQDHCPGDRCDADAERLSGEADDAATLSNIAFITTGAATVTAAVLWYLGAPRAVHASAGPSGAALSVRTHF